MSKWRTLACVLAFGVTACGPIGGGSAPKSELANAVAAFRAGDWDAFAAARDRAREALTASLAEPTGDDPCTGDILTLGNQTMDLAGTNQLDQRRVMSMSEEARFVFAVSQVGSGPREPENPPPGYEKYNDCSTQDFNKAGASDPGKARRIRQTAMSYAEELKAWQADLQTRHGEDFDDRMKQAVKVLDQNGVSARWPAEIMTPGRG